MKDSIIAYHGTSLENAREIYKSKEFKRGTYFAFKKIHAVRFGGNCVFGVKFCCEPKHWKGESDGWQFHLRESWPYKYVTSCKRHSGLWHRSRKQIGGAKNKGRILISPSDEYYAMFYDDEFLDGIVEFLNERDGLPR